MSMISNENLFQMLIFSYGLWNLDKFARIGEQDLDSPLDALALVLNSQIAMAEKRGLYRHYEDVVESTLRPRGALIFSDTIKLRAVGGSRVVVNTDELNINNSVNQNLRWAVNALLRSERVSSYTKRSLRVSNERLKGVCLIGRPTRSLPTDRLHARRPEYRIGLSVVSLLSDCFQIAESDEASGLVSKSTDFDSVVRSQLFENFVREFYRYHLRDARVTGRNMRWNDTGSTFEPIMRTDVNIERQNSVLVIDTKYYSKALGTRQDFVGLGGPKIRSAHLYQMFAYLAYTIKNNPAKLITGILLYPENEAVIDHSVSTLQGPIRVKTIDFKKPWAHVEGELLALV